MKLLNYTAVKNKSCRGKIIMNNLTPYNKICLLTKLLEEELGYEKAHTLIDRAEQEYATILNCANI